MKFLHYSHTKDFRPDPLAVWLQGVGWVAGIPATDAKPGMHMLYNLGSSKEIIAVKPKGKTKVCITVIGMDGKEWTDVRGGIIPCQYPQP